MGPRKGTIISALMLVLVATVFPSASFAVRLGNTENPRPSFLVDISVIIKTTYASGLVDYSVAQGTGSLIAQDLVVTAAHVVQPPPRSNRDRERGIRHTIDSVSVTGMNRNGTEFTLEAEYVTIADLHPDQTTMPQGSDVAMLRISDPREEINNVEVLPLPHEVGVDVSRQSELIGTLYGTRIPDRAAIEQADSVYHNPDRSLTERGGREFPQNSNGQEKRRRMAAELAMSATRMNPMGQPAPFVRLRIPHAPPSQGEGQAEPNLFAGRLPQRAILTFDLPDYIDRAVRASEMLPIHDGDSGSPFVSLSPDGRPYLAGVVSSILCQGCGTGGGGSVFRFSGQIAAADLRDLLRDGFERNSDLTQYRSEERNISLWNDPRNNVLTAATWSDENGVRLNGLPPDWNAHSTPLLCSANSSVEMHFCRYLQRGPTRTYNVTAEYIFLSGRDNATNGSGEFRVSGQIGFYSPQNYDYNDVVSSPIDEVTGYAFNVPSSTPSRIRVSERREDGRNASRAVPIRSPETVSISAAEHNPVICLATTREGGLYTQQGHVLVPPREVSCIIPSPTNRSCTGDNETHAIWLGDEHDGALVFVDIAPTSDEDIVIAFLGRVWQLPFGLI